MLSSSTSGLLDGIVSQIRSASKSALSGPTLFSKREYQASEPIHSELTGLIKARIFESYNGGLNRRGLGFDQINYTNMVIHRRE